MKTGYGYARYLPETDDTRDDADGMMEVLAIHFTLINRDGARPDEVHLTDM